MENYCAFSQEHKCMKWEDYELACHELEEADRLCHGNWMEIQRLYAYIDELRAILEGIILITQNSNQAKG